MFSHNLRISSSLYILSDREHHFSAALSRAHFRVTHSPDSRKSELKRVASDEKRGLYPSNFLHRLTFNPVLGDKPVRRAYCTLLCIRCETQVLLLVSAGVNGQQRSRSLRGRVFEANQSTDRLNIRVGCTVRLHCLQVPDSDVEYMTRRCAVPSSLHCTVHSLAKLYRR